MKHRSPHPQIPEPAQITAAMRMRPGELQDQFGALVLPSTRAETRRFRTGQRAPRLRREAGWARQASHAARAAPCSLFWVASRLCGGLGGRHKRSPSASARCACCGRGRPAPRAPTCAAAKSDPRLAFLPLTCGFGLAAELSGPDRGVNRAQAEVVSGAPTTGERALTSGYLLVETRSPLPGPTRRRPQVQ